MFSKSLHAGYFFVKTVKALVLNSPPTDTIHTRLFYHFLEAIKLHYHVQRQYDGDREN